MNSSRDPLHCAQASLHGWLAISLAFEEAAISALSDGAARLRRDGRDAAAAEIEGLVRRHRVGLVKHRALMAARGIEV